MRQIIRSGGAGAVQCIVTSPPYWGLRDYGVEGQLGLEPTLDEFIANMVEVFELCREVLADDGTLWMNMGDCYVNKSLTGQPWKLALAMKDAGWFIRQDIIWHKPNPMPETLRDRCTKAHEYVFLMSKSERYYYDFEAMQEPVSGGTHARRSTKMPDGWDTGEGSHGSFHRNGREKGRTADTPSGWATGDERKHSELAGRYSGTGVGFGRGYDKNPKPRVKNNASFDEAMAVMPETRNRRSVWTIPTQSYAEAHFATFPEALVEPCIIAGTRPGDIVFDPFLGSGTTAQVAQRLGRRWIGCELNPDYINLQAERTRQQGLILTA